jgi:putative PEP-CTERM system TPR-repeat lipoprotein
MDLKKQKIIVFGTFLLCGSLSANSAVYDKEVGLEQRDDIFKDTFLLSEPKKSAQEMLKQQTAANYREILRLIKQNKKNEARQKLNKMIQDNPEQSVYYNLKALLAILDKNPQQAEKIYQKAISLNPNNSQAIVGLSKLALDNKQYDKAKRYAEQALDISPQAISAYKILADIAIQQQGIEAAEKLLLQAKTRQTNNIKFQLAISKLLGKIYLAQKQPQKLNELATNLAKKYPDNISVLSFLAEAQIANQQWETAEKTLRKIIAKQPEDVKHRFLLARLLSRQNDKVDEVLDLLDDAAKHIENPNLILAYKVAFLIKQKQFDEALAIARKIDKQYPARSIGKILLGDIFLAQKKYQQALENYQLAYQQTPIVKLLDRMVAIYELLNQPDKAIAFLKNELKKYPDNDQIRFRLANAYQKAEMFEQSSQVYQALLSKQPENPILLNNLAWALYKKGNAKALEYAEKAYEKAPKSAAILDTYGVVLLKHGDKQKALEVLEQAAETKAPDIQLHLAEAYYANQKLDKAKQVLQSLIEAHVPQEKQAVDLLNKWKK